VSAEVLAFGASVSSVGEYAEPKTLLGYDSFHRRWPEREAAITG
jgi:hypothetical protein